jgi:GNAT superfamily N-acetyltransferase
LTSVQIRPAEAGDVERIAELMAQLGYDVPAAALAGRLRRRDGRREVLVAVSAGRIVAWAAVCTDEPFVEGFGAQLEGLVVDESSRGRGAGAQLLDAAEAWARDRGGTEMRVKSNVVRERAHAFYKRQGYRTIKSQYHLRKALRPR